MSVYERLRQQNHQKADKSVRLGAGVGFRYRTEHAAESVGATGWVRNDPDGSVFMEIQGTEEQIDRVFAMVSQGTYVNIEKMDAKSILVVEDERGFHTRESLGDFWGLWHR